MRSVLVTGVAAAGKSTIGRALAASLSFPFFEYADFMLRVLGQNERDSILTIPLAQRGPIYTSTDAAIHAVFSTRRDVQYALLTIHLSVKVGSEIHTFADEHYAALLTAAILLVEADPGCIRNRRLLDVDRHREIDSAEGIAAQQTLNAEIAHDLSDTYSLPLFAFDNNLSPSDLSPVTEWLFTLE